jgi:hypothetical protein
MSLLLLLLLLLPCHHKHHHPLNQPTPQPPHLFLSSLNLLPFFFSLFLKRLVKQTGFLGPLTDSLVRAMIVVRFQVSNGLWRCDNDVLL